MARIDPRRQQRRLLRRICSTPLKRHLEGNLLRTSIMA
jgi:hypothetical protein